MGQTTAPTGEARRSNREIWWTTGFIALLAIGLAAWAIWGDAAYRPVLVTLAVVVALIALFVHRMLSADAIRLTATHVEMSGLFGVRRLGLSEIAGARPGAVIQLLDEAGRIRMALPDYGARSPVILRWVQGLRNISWEEAIEVLDTLEADPRLGFNTADRQAHLRSMQRISRALSLGSLAIIIWSFVPVPYDLLMIVAAILPVIALAIVALRPWIFTVGGGDPSGIYPDLSAMIWTPCVVFVARAMTDVDLSPWHPPLLAACAVAGVLTALVWMIDPKARSTMSMVVLVPVLVAMAWGGLSIANARYDTSPQVVTPVIVSYTDFGRFPSVTVRFPDAYGGGEHSLRTPLWLVREAKDGVPVCLVVSDGLFGWSHRFLTPCDMAL